MALKHPVAVYVATSNFEAHEVRLFLGQYGVEAHVTEDASIVGLWLGGTLPGIHTPRVWVDRSNAERAADLIRNSHWGEKHGLPDTDDDAPSAEPAENECLACGKEFPEQSAKCPSCGWTFAADGDVN